MGKQRQDAGPTMQPSEASVVTAEKSPADVMGLEAITFGYGLPLMRLGAKRPLEAEDIPPVPAKDRASVVVENLLQAWLAECSQRPKSPSLPRAIFKAFRHKILLGAFWSCLESAARIGQPVLIGGFLRALRRDDEAPLYSFAGGLAVVAMLQSIIHHQAYYVNMTTGWNLRIALTGLLHWRMLRLRSSTLESASAGDWRNLVANDCQRFELAWTFIQYGWLSFLDLIAVFILLVLEVSWLPTVAGTAVVFVFIVLMLSFAKQFAKRRSITASITDKRLELTAQVLEAMMSIKIFCWESTFADRIVKIRKDEHSSIFKRQVLVAANSTMYYVLAPLSSLALFLVLAATDEELSLASSYVVLSLLLALRISFGKGFARFSQSAPECYASSLRIQRFLSQPDVPAIKIALAEAEQAALEVTAATFTWPDGGPTALPLVSLAVKQGELLVVAGPVGCGKSALLQGLLGELDLKQGSVVLRGSLAYAPQAPWIMAGTLQSNILFGLPLEPAWYQEVLEACCLLDDVEQLGPQGDLTEIGERGVNLSGGQRARVGLARAVYARPAICLLDDPLSAVDPAVSRHLVSWCLKGSVLAKAAVVLCTHQASVYSLADRMLLLGESGTVGGFGTPSEVAAQCNLDLVDAKLLTKDSKAQTAVKEEAGLVQGDAVTEDAQGDADGPQATDEEETREPAPPKGLSGLGKSQASLVKAEDKKQGGIGWRTYVHYMQLAGVSLSALVFGLFVSSTATMLLANYWLGLWAQAEDDGEDGRDHAIVFACFTAATVVFACLRSVLFYAATLRAASSLHSNALNSVLATQLSFFTSNPLGRVLNRFSGDLNNVDEQLSESMHEVADLGFTAAGALIVICVAVPPVIPGFAVMFWYMIVLRRFVVKSMTELKRWDTVTRSPVLDCFTALKGLACIRAFQREDSMHAVVLGLLEKNAKAWYWWLITNRFIGFRLDCLCVVIVALAAFGSAALREFMPAELAALAVANAVGLAGVFQFMVRQSALVESFMASFERLETYSILPPEVDEGKTSPPEGFPAKGTVQMEGVRMRYRDDLPEVLKGVDFTCPGGAKAGLVGRTGSGKSSLFMAVSRLAEITEGTVRIDDVDVSTMPLSTLRRCIAWVPQEPSFFSGSLRMNLDPLGSHTDEELLQALRQVQMDSVVQANGLDSVIAERGSNYSVGERQLLSLARALLQKRRILCMDEAFANVDFDTDQKVQEAVRMATDTVKATVLVIAHRLQSIADSDYIVVMDNGRVAECGEPKQLLLRHQEDPQNRGDGKAAEGASYAALLGGHA